MEVKLSDLAAQWRTNKNTPNADKLVRQYRAILMCMIELGFQNSLDVDAELPKRLMPPEYFELFQGH
jgi:hypothetical protein